MNIYIWTKTHNFEIATTPKLKSYSKKVDRQVHPETKRGRKSLGDAYGISASLNPIQSESDQTLGSSNPLTIFQAKGSR